MKRKGNGRRAIWLTVSILTALALCGGIGYYARRSTAEPVSVYPFSDIGMTEYWGDNKESDGMVTADRVQTVYLSETQRVKQVMVQQGDTVKKGDVLVAFDTTLSELELERKRLDVEKLKLKMEQAQERLKEINQMVPMVMPAPQPNSNIPGGMTGYRWQANSRLSARTATTAAARTGPLSAGLAAILWWMTRCSQASMTQPVGFSHCSRRRQPLGAIRKRRL